MTEFVFGCEDDTLRNKLHQFWLNHQDAYQSELRSIQANTARGSSPLEAPHEGLRRETGAIARKPSGTITGIAFVALKAIDPSLGLGTHAYFVRMYNQPNTRSAKIAAQLFKTFLDGFEQATNLRDHRAHYLIAEAISPRMHRPSMRRYFARLGFRLQGSNKRGSEIWTRRLATRFVF